MCCGRNQPHPCRPAAAAHAAKHAVPVHTVQRQPSQWIADHATCPCTAITPGTAFETAHCTQQDNAYMTDEIFIKYIECTVLPCTEELREVAPILLVYDNASPHVSYKALKYLQDNNVDVITLPPHSSHATQPLDVAIMQPLKQYYDTGENLWRKKGSNLSAVASAEEMLEILATPYGTELKSPWERAFSTSNIISGFKKAGIWPLDKTAIADEYSAAPSRSAVLEKRQRRDQHPEAAVAGGLLLLADLADRELHTQEAAKPFQIPQAVTARLENQILARLHLPTGARFMTSAEALAQLEAADAAKRTAQDKKAAAAEARQDKAAVKRVQLLEAQAEQEQALQLRQELQTYAVPAAQAAVNRATRKQKRDEQGGPARLADCNATRRGAGARRGGRA